LSDREENGAGSGAERHSAPPAGPPRKTHWERFESREQAIEAARSLVPALRRRAAEAETRRMISEETIADLRSNGLFHLCAPRAFGGSQLGIATFVETVAEISAACGSSGWVYAVLAGHNWTVSLLPVEAQQEVFSDPDALVASVIHLSSKPPELVEGGYLIEEASGRFCSGVDYASWILVGSQVATDGKHAEPHYFLIPRTEFEITDDWYAVGLRGTGSKSVKADRIFVPAHRCCSLADVANGTAPGVLFHDSPVYRVPFRQSQRLQLVGVPIGIARGALAHCEEHYRRRYAGSGRDAGEAGTAAFLRLARAHVAYDAAVGLVLGDARTLDSLEEGAVSAIERARHLRNIAYAAQECRRVVSGLFEESGARGLLEENELQRIWRDAHSAAAHSAFVRDTVDLPFGRAVCGLEEEVVS
jgi:alkylation response protein AidB-like acyl-CoA dehydrogenase